MKNLLIKLLMLMLVLTLAVGLVACNNDSGDNTGDNGSGDGTGGGGDGTGDTGAGADDKTYGDAENLLLIDGNVANFRVVTTNEVSGSMVKNAQKFVDNLRELGITVEDAVKDNNAADVVECEIIIGSGVRYRDEKYVVSSKSLGDKGYVIKIVDNKVLIAGGNESMTNTAWNYFLKNVIELTAKTESVDNLTLKRDFVKLVETEYLIDSIKVAGTDLSEYVLLYDLKASDSMYDLGVDNLRSDLYAASGYWLEQGSLESADSYAHKFIIRSVDECGEDGFRFYVSGDDLIMECAYANSFKKAYDAVITEVILDKMGDVVIPSTFDKTYCVSKVYYSEFGAVGDGRKDDFTALYNAHVFANQCGQTVMGDPNAVYYVHEFATGIPVKTNVNFNNAVFIIDDLGSGVFANYSTPLFSVMRDHDVVYIGADKIQELFPEVTVKTTDTKLEWLAPYLEAKSLVRFTNDHRDFIRHGGNIDGGYQRTDVVVVDKDGTIDPDTPVIFDFVAGTQLINTGRQFNVVTTKNLTKIEIFRTDDTPITIENGYFNREVCQVVAETGFENKWRGYNRGFTINRSNVTIKNITHRLQNEPEMPTTGDGRGDDGKLRQSYPYYGMLYFYNTYNSGAYNCDLNGHTTYYEDKSTSASSIPMGSYDFVIEYSSHITMEDITSYVDIADSQYWGIMSSNGSKNMSFTDCSLSRFDAHRGFWNASLVDCDLGLLFNVVGGGKLYCNNVERIAGANFISLRGDYGANFRGDMELINCHHQGYASYRGMRGVKNDSLVIINAGYSSNYKGQYIEGNAAAFPYLKWDFGYTCYMPQNLIIDNFTSDVADVVVYNDIGDAAFQRPSDFVDVIDYQGKTVPDGSATGRPMTPDDVYYNQYQITKSITFRNMNKLRICQNTSLICLNAIPVTEG